MNRMFKHRAKKQFGLDDITTEDLRALHVLRNDKRLAFEAIKQYLKTYKTPKDDSLDTMADVWDNWKG